ncbi:ATP-binding protein [Zoogloea sp.]|uniref:sensor histidine kinase n=1 Tax=Zoogloea sp. TaxID=49181 RepID=UPI0035B39D42
MKAAALEGLRLLPLFIGFVGLYYILDKVSFGHALFGLNLTPWNPAPALGLVLVMRFGRAAWAPLTIAVLLAEIGVHGHFTSLWIHVLPGLVLALGYALLGEVLARRLPRDALLDDRRTLVAWLLRVVIGSLLISLAYLLVLRIEGLLPTSGWWQGLKHFWVGDGVGIAVMMPLLLWLTSKRGRRRLQRSVLNRESVGYALLGVATLWLAFGVGGHSGFKLFYLLFLPIVWAAGRQGMAGAIVCAALLQVGVIAAMRLLNYNAVTVAELQILAMAMAVVGFFVGAVVNEQRRTTQDLRHSLRLAAAGEMAGALAHELHHPLTALTAYAGACEQLLERGETGEQLHAAIRCVLRESGKAGDVVKRLQDFFRTGDPQPEVLTLATLVEAAAAPYRLRAEQAGIVLRVAPMPEVSLMVDRLQMEVVLRSLLANAFDAVADSPRQPRRIWVAAWKDGSEQVCLRVEDSGSGLSPERVTNLFDPLDASNSGSRGFGLAISRAIVATHGGRLWGEAANHGIFKIELPILAADSAPPPTKPVFSESDT